MMRRGVEEKDLGCTLSELQEYSTVLFTGHFVHISSPELMYLSQLNFIPFGGHFPCLNPHLITSILYSVSVKLTLLDFTYA